MGKKFIVGSRAFFGEFPDFKPSDLDSLEIIDDPKGEFENCCRARIYGNCYIKWRNMSSDEFISFHLKFNSPIMAGKFLVPEFIEFIGLTIEQLKQLEPLFERLDERHRYQKIIYDSYIENNAFILTDDQLSRAFESYKSTRKDNNSHRN